MKKVYIIGIGMNGGETLNERAREIIKSSDCIIGAKRMLVPFEGLNKPVLSSYDNAEISEFIKASEHENFAVLMSGDCGFYSGAEKLLPLLSDCETEVICGISSLQYFCGKLRIPWQNVKCVSLHGVSANIARNATANFRCFFLLGGKSGAQEVCERLTEYDLGEVTVHIGENLAYSDEKIISGTVRELAKSASEFGKLSVLLTENTGFEKVPRFGISDSEFIRGDVPITKSEVRAIVASKLNIGARDIVWDIGSGTGSVSVEAALQCVDGTVFAVDSKPEAQMLTRQNAAKFRCDNIIVINGKAPDCLENLPPPDKVFIGGSGGCMAEIVAAAFAKNSDVTIVITAVSLESVSTAMSAFSAVGITPEIIQAAITRTRCVGTHTMLNAENPVFIISGGLR